MQLIEGIKVTNLNQIHDERGSIMHMLKSTDSHYIKFGEIYFSLIHYQAIKAWHIHKSMTLNYATVHGKIKFVVFDNREGSPTNGLVNEFFLSQNSYKLITVPPMLWNGFKGLSQDTAIVANCSSIPHDPSEISRLPHNDSSIPYEWAIKHG